VSTPVPVICGPTAGGKSDLALALTRLVCETSQGRECWPGGAAILAADAFQVYQGLDIASGKPTTSERAQCPHLLLDIVDPRETFTANQWLALAQGAIADCVARGQLAIVVGGTHLYIKLLMDGMFQGPAADEALREQLRGRGLSALREELARVDPAAAERIHPNDERRTIRALEVYQLTGKPISEHQTQWDIDEEANAEGFTFVLTMLDWPVELINRRINARVKQMMERGMLEETRGLLESGALGATAREALGTKQLVDFLERRCTLEEAVERIKIDTRRFAKNQRTWLKRLRTRSGTMVLDASVASNDGTAQHAIFQDGTFQSATNEVAAPPVGEWAQRIFDRLTAL